MFPLLTMALRGLVISTIRRERDKTVAYVEHFDQKAAFVLAIERISKKYESMWL